jgi:hypothetical protein
MIKLTVMYNLPPGTDHEEFLKWRTTEHQKANMSIPGVIKSDFYAVRRTFQSDYLPYAYLTEAYFPDMETFENFFYEQDYQEKLAESLKRIADPLFLISEEIISETTELKR